MDKQDLINGLETYRYGLNQSAEQARELVIAEFTALQERNQDKQQALKSIIELVTQKPIMTVQELQLTIIYLIQPNITTEEKANETHDITSP